LLLEAGLTPFEANVVAYTAPLSVLFALAFGLFKNRLPGLQLRNGFGCAP
jgi:hypothetical protein